MIAQIVPATAVQSEDRSDAVVVSFDSRWYDALRTGSLSMVIRKKVPMSEQPHWLYFHVNSPKSAICARTRILAVEHLPTQAVHAFVNELSLTSEEIDRYCGHLKEVGVYRLSDIELAAPEASLAELRRRLHYSPPQNFMFLSIQAKGIVDQACAFAAEALSVQEGEPL